MTGKRNRHRWSRRLRVPAALAATGGLGATLALLGSQGGGSAHLSPSGPSDSVHPRRREGL